MAEHTERFRVQWLDTDAGGRIHFTAAFRWVEAAELALYRRIGMPRELVGNLPRRHVEATYHRTLVFDDEVEMTLRVDRVGTTSITYAWSGARAGELAIEGRYTIVLVDSDGVPIPVSDELRVKLT